ncbi:MAG: L,D-transpeptidase family protein [Selenomonadaceae bacterium]|nr:L,D-transpeptidase family protein [Selenomonadaceae bacterium]
MRLFKIIAALFLGIISLVEISLAECGSKKIVINLPSRSLALYDDNTKVRLYPIAIGRPSSTTPVGYFKISSKDKNPTWTDPSNHRNVIPSGPSNPLGYRWMQLYGNYGIHGTNNPSSIGHYVSNGCIRMKEENVEELFDLVEIGTPVEINYNRVIVEKTPEGVVAYYVYPDIYNRQKLNVDMIKNWLKGYGVENFVSDEDIIKKIKASDGAPSFVGKSNTIILNGEKLKDKAVQFDGVMYLPTEKIAEKLEEKIEWNKETGIITTHHGASAGSVKNDVLYMDARDLEKLFQIRGGLNDNNFVIGSAEKAKGNNIGTIAGMDQQKAAQDTEPIKKEQKPEDVNNTVVNTAEPMVKDGSKTEVATGKEEKRNIDSVKDTNTSTNVKKGSGKKGRPVIVRNTKNKGALR